MRPPPFERLAHQVRVQRSTGSVGPEHEVGSERFDLVFGSGNGPRFEHRGSVAAKEPSRSVVEAIVRSPFCDFGPFTYNDPLSIWMVCRMLIVPASKSTSGHANQSRFRCGTREPESCVTFRVTVASL